MLTSLFRGVRLIFLAWIVLVLLAIALGFVHKAHRRHNDTRPVFEERVR